MPHSECKCCGVSLLNYENDLWKQPYFLVLAQNQCVNVLFKAYEVLCRNMTADLMFPLLVSSCQVLEVVRSNYDTLTLKLQDGLDQFERYSEQPKEVAFFKELVRDDDVRWLKSLYNLFQFSISSFGKE